MLAKRAEPRKVTAMGEPDRSRGAGLSRGAARLAGEFVVIVLGVLVALAVDEWREVRAERAREVGYYRALLGDLDRDLAEYDFAIEFTGVSLDAARDVLSVIEGRARAGEGSLAEALRRASWVNYPAWSSGTMDELLGSGSIRLLRDPVLKRALLAYHDFVNEWKPRLQGPEFRTFLEYRRAKPDENGLISDLDAPAEDVLAAMDRDLGRRLPGDLELRGIVRGMIGEWTVLLEMLEQQRAMAESLRALVGRKLPEGQGR
jgi:hypothetical protein